MISLFTNIKNCVARYTEYCTLGTSNSMPGMLREQAANVLEQTANYDLASTRDFFLSPPFNTLRCFEYG